MCKSTLTTIPLKYIVLSFSVIKGSNSKLSGTIYAQMVMFYCVYTMHVTAEKQKARNLMQVVSMQTKIAGT